MNVFCFRKIGVLIIASLFCLGLAGCHTVQGLGQDIEAGGRVITKAADDTKKHAKSKHKAAPKSDTQSTDKQ